MRLSSEKLEADNDNKERSAMFYLKSLSHSLSIYLSIFLSLFPFLEFYLFRMFYNHHEFINANFLTDGSAQCADKFAPTLLFMLAGIMPTRTLAVPR